MQSYQIDQFATNKGKDHKDSIGNAQCDTLWCDIIYFQGNQQYVVTKRFFSAK